MDGVQRFGVHCISPACLNEQIFLHSRMLLVYRDEYVFLQYYKELAEIFEKHGPSALKFSVTKRKSQTKAILFVLEKWYSETRDLAARLNAQ